MPIALADLVSRAKHLSGNSSDADARQFIYRTMFGYLSVSISLFFVFYICRVSEIRASDFDARN